VCERVTESPRKSLCARLRYIYIYIYITQTLCIHNANVIYIYIYIYSSHFYCLKQLAREHSCILYINRIIYYEYVLNYKAILYWRATHTHIHTNNLQHM
jgi:hypothetical protein